MQLRQTVYLPFLLIDPLVYMHLSPPYFCSTSIFLTSPMCRYVSVHFPYVPLCLCTICLCAVMSLYTSPMCRYGSVFVSVPVSSLWPYEYWSDFVLVSVSISIPVSGSLYKSVCQCQMLVCVSVQVCLSLSCLSLHLPPPPHSEIVITFRRKS